MTKKLPELTKTEWLVMKCCWGKGKSTAREVYEEALKQKTWQYQTVKTMLDRLVQKGYMKMDKIGPICLYEPTVSQTKVLAKAMDSFLWTVLDGTLAPMLAHMAKGRKLNDEEMTSLKKLIEQQEGNEEEKR
jgi:BlaI family transcriptional regulator, penicillinase repressor